MEQLKIKTMARKKVTIELTEEEKKAIYTYLTLSEKYAKSFFWRSTGTNATQRRSQEKKDYFEFKNERLDISFQLKITCTRYYVSKHVFFDSIFHNARFLRNLL